MIKFGLIIKRLGIVATAAILVCSNIQAATPTTTTPNPEVMTGVQPIAAQPAQSISAAPNINARAYVLMDANSGEILASRNPNQRLEPASLTKMMSMYVISQALQSGRIHLTDMVTISKEAWRTGGSRMFVQVGTQVPVQELINGIVVVSGNDAAVAMAEYVGGSQDHFVDMMNQAAASLGMKNSHFMDVNGLPIANHYTSARDLAILAQALINDFPDHYKVWYSQKWFEYNNIKQSNRNRLLWRDASIDGIKTGHTNAAGYCLVASAERNGMRLISVVLGEPSPTARASDSLALLNWGFRSYSSHQLYAANQPLAEAQVWFGKNKSVPLGLNRGLFVTIPNGQYQNLKASLTINKYLEAPISKGQPYGNVSVSLNNQALLSEPVVALQDNPKGNVISRSLDRVILLFHNVS